MSTDYVSLTTRVVASAAFLCAADAICDLNGDGENKFGGDSLDPLGKISGGLGALVANMFAAIDNAFDKLFSESNTGEENKEETTPEKKVPEVNKGIPPTHPDFEANKKKLELQPIPDMGPGKKGYKDKKGNYWEPVPDGHKGYHDPHWDVQHPDGSHTPKYPG